MRTCPPLQCNRDYGLKLWTASDGATMLIMVSNCRRNVAFGVVYAAALSHNCGVIVNHSKNTAIVTSSAATAI